PSQALAVRVVLRSSRALGIPVNRGYHLFLAGRSSKEPGVGMGGRLPILLLDQVLQIIDKAAIVEFLSRPIGGSLVRMFGPNLHHKSARLADDSFNLLA